MRECICPGERECLVYEIGAVKKRMIREGDTVTTTYKLIEDCEIYNERIKAATAEKPEKTFISK